MLDDKEAIQQLERQCRYSEEIEGDDHLAVILEEGQPPLARVATALNPPKIPGYGPFRDDETQLLKFAATWRPRG